MLTMRVILAYPVYRVFDCYGALELRAWHVDLWRIRTFCLRAVFCKFEERNSVTTTFLVAMHIKSQLTAIAYVRRRNNRVLFIIPHNDMRFFPFNRSFQIEFI